jgi:hypothetical protein
MFLRGIRMTDIVKKLNMGIENLARGTKASRFGKGVEAINLAQIFEKRGITFGPSDFNGNEM